MRKYIVKGLLFAVVALCAVQRSASAQTAPPQSTPSISAANSEARSMAYYEAKRELVYGQVDRAKVKLQRIIKRWGDFPPALYNLSQIHLYQSDTTAALDAITRALKIDSTCQDYLREHAGILTLMGDTQNSEIALRKLLKLTPHDREAQRQLALALLSSSQTDKQDQGLEFADQWESHFGYDGELTARKNMYYYGRGDGESLKSYAQKMLASDRNAANLLNYARILASMGSKDEASEAAQQAQNLARGDINTLLQLANFWRVDKDAEGYLGAIDQLVEYTEIFPSQGRIDMLYEYFNLGGDPSSPKAKDVFKKAYTAGTDSVFSTFYMDYTLFTQDWDGAIDVLSEELAQERISPRGGEILMQLYMQAQKSDSALMTIDELEKIERPMVNGDLIAGNILSMMDRYEHALEKYELALEKSENDSTRSLIYGSMGMMFSEQGKNKETVRAYERSLKFDPSNILSLNNLAYHISENSSSTNELERALAMANTVVDAEPNNPTYIDTQAWILYKLGRLQEALDRMHLVMGLDQNPSIEVLEHMAEILRAMDKGSQAEIYEDKIRKLNSTNGNENQ